jgi:hypothetical protein
MNVTEVGFCVVENVLETWLPWAPFWVKRQLSKNFIRVSQIEPEHPSTPSSVCINLYLIGTRLKLILNWVKVEIFHCNDLNENVGCLCGNVVGLTASNSGRFGGDGVTSRGVLGSPGERGSCIRTLFFAGCCIGVVGSLFSFFTWSTAPARTAVASFGGSTISPVCWTFPTPRMLPMSTVGCHEPHKFKIFDNFKWIWK